jgi:uncharacterized protein (TIGR01777 family)
MKLILAGGSGRLGLALSAALVAEGHAVVVLSRKASDSAPSPARRHGDDRPAAIREVAWSADGTAGPWARELNDTDVVVNLAGAGIADAQDAGTQGAPTLESHPSTRSLVKPCAPGSTPAIQHCAVGYYGASLDDRVFDESSPAGSDFFGQLASAWEAEAAPARSLGCRLVVIRSGVVLERGGGALPKMLMPFRLFVGGPVASGRQYLSWIHIDDWTRLMMWSIHRPTVTGPINATAPNPVTNREFSTALGRAARRPSWAPVPAFVLRVLFGEMADAALINGQRVVPTRAGADSLSAIQHRWAPNCSSGEERAWTPTRLRTPRPRNGLRASGNAPRLRRSSAATVRFRRIVPA